MRAIVTITAIIMLATVSLAAEQQKQDKDAIISALRKQVTELKTEVASLKKQLAESNETTKNTEKPAPDGYRWIEEKINGKIVGRKLIPDMVQQQPEQQVELTPKQKAKANSLSAIDVTIESAEKDLQDLNCQLSTLKTDIAKARLIITTSRRVAALRELQGQYNSLVSKINAAQRMKILAERRKKVIESSIP